MRDVPQNQAQSCCENEDNQKKTSAGKKRSRGNSLSLGEACRGRVEKRNERDHEITNFTSKDAGFEFLRMWILDSNNMTALCYHSRAGEVCS